GTLFLSASCRKAVSKTDRPAREALAFLGVLGDPADLSLFESYLEHPALGVAAATGMGSLGRIAAVPILIEPIKNPRISYPAGFAFTRMTGADDIFSGPPVPPPDDLTEEEKERWGLGPSPDPDRAQAWWLKEKARFHADGRWQAGIDVRGNPLGEPFNSLPL